MKVFVTFCVAIIAVSAIPDQELWEQFKTTHNKNYPTIEEKLRFSIFQNNLRTIENHNDKFARGETTYTMGITRFADLTNEEFSKLLTYKQQQSTAAVTYKPDPHFEPPPSVDWRNTGAVLEVKDQGTCGSCWAFSTTGVLEAQDFLKNNRSVSLSEQYLVDCSTVAGNMGCDGGDVGFALDYVTAKGIATEESYPYTGIVDYCKDGDKGYIIIDSYTRVDATEYSLAYAVAAKGPIATVMNADILQHYSSGIIDESDCSAVVNHAVLAVGYGSENNTDYWVIKNSWGPSWGEAGYFRIVRNFQCGLGSWNAYPNVV